MGKGSEGGSKVWVAWAVELAGVEWVKLTLAGSAGRRKCGLRCGGGGGSSRLLLLLLLLFCPVVKPPIVLRPLARVLVVLLLLLTKK